MPAEAPRYKRPESVLVVVYTGIGEVLLLRRADDPVFWQSVTGSMKWGERNPRETAVRELAEETGLVATDLRDLGLCARYAILPQWRWRYAPGITHNVEHAFALELPRALEVTLNPTEHTEYAWLDFESAAQRAASWSNRDAIIHLNRTAGARNGGGHQDV